MFCGTMIEFPELSSNVQYIVSDPTVSKVKLTPVVPVTITSQLSVVVGGITVKEHSAVKSGNTGVAGAVVSVTVMV